MSLRSRFFPLSSFPKKNKNTSEQRHDIGNGGRRGKSFQGQHERRFARHAKAGGVDQKLNAAKRKMMARMKAD